MPSKNSLITTKLSLPPGRTGLVIRPRLMRALDEGLSRRITLISAPAGFGKTTLLSEWHKGEAGRSCRMAWLSLDAEDNDPPRFVTYLAAALGTIQGGLGEEVLAALDLPEPPAVETLLTSLINGLDALEGSCALVIDDYHLITSREVQAAVQFLVEHLPGKMHLVLLTRSDPPLPLARLRALNDLFEIRAPDLRFQPQEAAEFLNGVMGLGLSGSDITALENRTEGWIAGLQLAALSLHQQSDKHAFVSAFAGDDRYIMDYLVEEVLQRQPPEIHTFLLKTSFLERLSGPLCTAVTGDQDAAAILSALDKGNLFVESLDTLRTWYRYHHLFADLLRRRLHQALPPAEIRTLYQRACAWYEREGLVAEAISLALAEPDHELAAGLLERHVMSVFFHGETKLVHSWLGSLPEATYQSRPLLCIMRAHTIAHTGGFQKTPLEQSKYWLDLGEKVLEETEREGRSTEGPGHPSVALIRNFIAMSRAYLALWRGDPPETVIELARRALSGLGPETAEGSTNLDLQRLRSGLNNNLGMAYLVCGNEDAAEAAFIEAQHVGEGCGDLLNMFVAIYRQVLLLREHGKLKEASALCRRALDFPSPADASPARPIPYISVIYLAYGQILLEWDELDAGEAILAKNLDLSRLIAAAGDVLVETTIALVRIHLARGNFQKAREILDQADSESFKGRILIPAWRTRLHLACLSENPGAIEEATQWSEGRGLKRGNQSAADIESLTLARVLIARQRAAVQGGDNRSEDLTPLLKFLERELQRAEKGRQVERMIELSVIQSLAFQVLNRLPEALKSTGRALDLAETGGYKRIFLDEGLPMRRLLQKLNRQGGSRNAYINHLLSAGVASAAEFKGVHQREQDVLLSARELEVLRLLESGCTNTEIAQRLVISLNTTKKHVSHIFEKLGINKRSEVVRRAKELGLAAQAPPN